MSSIRGQPNLARARYWSEGAELTYKTKDRGTLGGSLRAAFDIKDCRSLVASRSYVVSNYSTWTLGDGAFGSSRLQVSHSKGVAGPVQSKCD